MNYTLGHTTTHSFRRRHVKTETATFQLVSYEDIYCRTDPKTPTHRLHKFFNQDPGVHSMKCCTGIYQQWTFSYIAVIQDIWLWEVISDECNLP